MMGAVSTGQRSARLMRFTAAEGEQQGARVCWWQQETSTTARVLFSPSTHPHRLVIGDADSAVGSMLMHHSRLPAAPKGSLMPANCRSHSDSGRASRQGSYGQHNKMHMSDDTTSNAFTPFSGVAASSEAAANSS